MSFNKTVQSTAVTFSLFYDFFNTQLKSEKRLDKLERFQNFCIRFIFGLRKYDHISEFRTKLKQLPIRLRPNTHILSLLYNVLFNPTTLSYLKKRFTLVHDTHIRCLRSSENQTLEIPKHSTTFTDSTVQAPAARTVKYYIITSGAPYRKS